MLLDTQSNSNYQVIGTSGELRIIRLDSATVGDYVCVTTLNDELGSFITTAVGITIRTSEQLFSLRCMYCMFQFILATVCGTLRLRFY